MYGEHVFKPGCDGKQQHVIIGLNPEDIDRLQRGEALVLPAVSGLRTTVVYGSTNQEQAGRVEYIAVTDPTGVRHWESRLE